MSEKSRGHTLIFGDDAWNRLVALAEIEGRVVTKQLEHLVDKRIAEAGYTQAALSEVIESLRDARKGATRGKAKPV